jgi:hypothetical protein
MAIKIRSIALHTHIYALGVALDNDPVYTQRTVRAFYKFIYIYTPNSGLTFVCRR